MNIDDAILINVFRTRLYLPLVLILLIYVFNGKFRNELSYITSKMIPKNAWMQGGSLFVISLIAAILVCYAGKSWGGDYSQYFAQARAIMNRDVENWYSVNNFIIDTSAEGIGSDVYPWIWPLCLIPVIRIFGFNIAALKVYEALFFAMAILMFYNLAKNRMNTKHAYVLSLFVAFNLNLLMDVNTIESDIPNLFAVLLAINIFDIFRDKIVNGNKIYQTVAYAVLLGLMFFISAEMRTMSKALVVAYILWIIAGMISDIWNKKHKYKFFAVKLIPICTYFVSYKIFHMFLPTSGGTYNDYFVFAIARFRSNLLAYLHVYVSILGNETRPIIAIICSAATIILLLLALVGMITKILDEFYNVMFVVVTMGMLLFYDYVADRFAYTSYVLLLIFAYEGAVYLYNVMRRQNTVSLIKFTKSAIKTFGLAAAIMMLVSYIVVAYNVRTNKYNLNDANSDYAMEVYDYIKTNLNEKDVVYFFKPRVLNFNTGVLSYTWYNQNGHLQDADYFLDCIDDGYDEVTKEAMDKGGKVVFENDRFRLYEL